MRAPIEAKVFIVGKNQATEFSVEKVGSHERHLNALFNRSGETCEGLYDAVREGKRSKSRPIIEMLTGQLARRGIEEVLETNVICYSTPMSRDLAKASHAGGAQKGHEIFHTLLAAIRPSILVAHGQGVATSLSRSLGITLPDPPTAPLEVVSAYVELGDYNPLVIVVPSLAMPAAAKWASWRAEHLAVVADRIAIELGRLELGRRTPSADTSAMVEHEQGEPLLLGKGGSAKKLVPAPIPATDTLQATPQRTADLTFLMSVASRTVDMWEDGLAEKIEPLGAVYAGDAEMEKVWGDAIESYTDFMIEEADRELIRGGNPLDLG